MQFLTALLAWLALLALAANSTTWASSADAASWPYDVNVKGGPEFVDEHSQLMLPGKYIATLFLELTQQQVSNAARVGAYTSGIRDGAPEGFQHLGRCFFLKIQRAMRVVQKRLGLACGFSL